MLSGGMFFATWQLLHFPFGLIVEVILAMFMYSSISELLSAAHARMPGAHIVQALSCDQYNANFLRAGLTKYVN